MTMSEQERVKTMDVFKKFQEQAKNARLEASTYVDLQEGDKTIVEVLLDKGVSTQEFEGKNGKYSKVKYTVRSMENGKTLDLLLTSKQSNKADEELEKLILHGKQPILRLKKIDNRTIDIEGVDDQH